MGTAKRRPRSIHHVGPVASATVEQLFNSCVAKRRGHHLYHRSLQATVPRLRIPHSETARACISRYNARILDTAPITTRHSRWVRLTHWIITAAFLTLAFTGVMILMVHPRLYWGEVGNDLMQPLIELPISRNYKHGGWTGQMAFSDSNDSLISASRTYDIFNQNGWGRSLHFLAGWFLVLTGALYLMAGFVSGHFRRSLWPKRSELSSNNIRADLVDHLRLRIRPATGGPDYGLLQKTAYVMIVFIALPLTFISGMTMSPLVVSTFPFLLDVFGGHQSARTIHFFSFAVLILFLIAHVFMVVKSGAGRSFRGMTVGVKNEE